MGWLGETGMSSRLQKKVVTLVIAALVLFLAAYEEGRIARPTPELPVPTPPVTEARPSSTSSTVHLQTTTTNAVVVHVADGDTITVRRDGEKNDEKVRLLGVNTPETVDPRRPVECFGKEASAFTKSTLQQARVFLKEDPQADNVDKYGRLLRIVVLQDGRELNRVLVQEGYAYAYVSFPMTSAYKSALRALEAEAKAAGRGLWNPSACAGQK